MLRKAAVPKGYCVNCAVTEWMANTYPCNMILEESSHGAQILLVPQIQEQFASIMLAANADASPEEIDWQQVVANWDLPLKVKRSGVNPHLPGDSMRRKLGHKEYKREQFDMFQSLRGSDIEDRLSYIPDIEDDGGYIC
jgi:hypothetical protein